MICENIENKNSAVRDTFGAEAHIERLDTARQEFLSTWFNALLTASVPDADIAGEILATLSAMEQLARMAEGVGNTPDLACQSDPPPRKKSADETIPWRVLP